MKKSYGNKPKKEASKSSPTKTNSTSLKIRLRGRDGAPLSMPELQQALYEIARRLKPYDEYRVKWATLYLTTVNEYGEQVLIHPQREWTIYPYNSAADEHGA